MTDETKRNVQAWIDALRSGEYEQGTDMLKNGKTDCFCCLGVLADLEVKKGTATWEPDSLGASYDYLVLPDGMSYMTDIPLAFNEKYGLTGESPLLVQLNDVWDYTFEQIADLLERKLIKGEAVDLIALTTLNKPKENSDAPAH